MWTASIRPKLGVLGVVVAAAAVTAATANAQTVDTVRQKETCICTPGAPGAPGAPRVIAPGAMGFRFFGRRAQLGVLLGDDVQVNGHSGVRVQEVVEGGPAQRAGLRAGDVITALDGTALGDDPAEAVMDHMDDVEPGDTVAVSYQRDGRSSEARVVAERAALAGMVAPGAPGAPGIERLRIAPAPPGQPGGVWELRSNGLEAPRALRLLAEHRGGLDLVDMNAGLGAYFGTSDGVLVTAVRDDVLGLKAGDVILSIGGREVMDADHAREIIASYRPDETIKFDIVRNKKHITVSGKRATPGTWTPSGK